MSGTRPSRRDETISLSAWREIDGICDRFEQAWDAHQRPKLEDYLVTDCSESQRHALLRDLLIVELECRRAGCEQASANEFHQRFPGYRAAVEQAFAVHHDDPTKGSDDNGDPQARQPQGFQIRCPHCHNSVEFVADGSLTDIKCNACGSHFNLIEDDLKTRAATTIKKVGHFELIERLGMGGFGSVWKARDTELDRAVAVKIPRRGQLPPEEAEKFLREARAAAQLRHPNIVGVHEVGRDGDTVYIVSDLIRGVPLAEWIEMRLPTPREAAELCIKICSALHHAHENGIVHRDLKPQNIMLDEDGQPHLMDFGLARREAGEITMTVDGQVLGTPAYMSPEQARGEAHKADRRTDIYSIGVILFQLLTGELPFRGQTRMLIHQVLHEDPPSPRKLNANIPRDLETICLKCMEKEARQRCETAQFVAEDLNRFLDGQPILARPISAVARGWRWCRRKPVAAALIILLSFISILGPLIAVRMAMLTAQARQASDQAEKEKLQRERAFDLLLQAFKSPNPARHGRSITVAEVLDRAVDTIRIGLDEDPYSQANLLNALGMTYFQLGLPREAIERLTEARELCVQELGEDAETTLIVTANLSRAHGADPGTEMAPFIEQLEDTLKRMKDKLGIDHAETLHAMMHLAAMYQTKYRYEDAVAVLDEAVTHYRSTLGEDHFQTLDCMTELAAALIRVDKCDQALTLIEIALPRLQAKLGADHFLSMQCLFTKADALFALDDVEAAVPMLEEVLSNYRTSLGEDHPATIRVMKKLTMSYRALGRYQEDAELSLEILEHVRRSPAAYEFGLMNALIYASNAMVHAGDPEQAELLARERLELAQQEAPDHWATFEAESMLGSVLVKLQRFDEAEPLVMEGYQGMTERLKEIPTEHLIVPWYGVNRIVELYDAWGKPEQAAKWKAERTRLVALVKRMQPKSRNADTR